MLDLMQPLVVTIIESEYLGKPYQYLIFAALAHEKCYAMFKILGFFADFFFTKCKLSIELLKEK